MTSGAHTGPVALTEAEQERAAEVERLAAQGAAGVPGLLGMLTDPSWSVRRKVVTALAAAGDAAVQPLCDLLATRRDHEGRIAAAVDALSASTGAADGPVVALASRAEPAVVADAAQILGRRRSSAGLPTLIRLVSHADDNVAVAAIEALGRVGGRAAVESLIQVVDSGNFFRVFPAIDVLGRSGDPRAVEPLTALLAQPHYALEAARALGRTGERAAVGPLAALLGAPSDAMVRVAAVSLCELFDRFLERSGAEVGLEETLRRHAPPGASRRLQQCLSGADVAEAAALCRLLGVVGGEEVVPVLTRRLEGPPAVARTAAEALKHLSRAADRQLAEALREADSVHRKALLPLISRTSASPEVVACLTDPDAEVRTLACDALARMGAPSTLPALFQALSDVSPRVVQAAIAAIQTLGTGEARTLAARAARDGSPTVRRAAMRILAYFGDAAALTPLLDGRSDADPRVREAALQGLPYLDDRRALEALLEAARAEDPRTRAAAMRALGHASGDARVHAFLLGGLSDADPWVRYYACQSLGRLAYEPAAARVAELLEDPAGQVRVAAVEALSHLRSEEAHRALLRAAGAEEPDVKRAALIGLGIRGRVEDLPLLLSAVATPDTATRLVALSAMAGLPSPTVMHTLARAAADPDEQVSTAAIGFLASRPEQEATDILVDLLPLPAARERALSALAVPSPGRVPGLLSALQAADDEVAPLLTAALARLHRADASGALLQALGMRNPAARLAAASTLSALGTPEAMSALAEAARSDPDPRVRQVCALLLTQ